VQATHSSDSALKMKKIIDDCTNTETESLNFSIITYAVIKTHDSVSCSHFITPEFYQRDKQYCNFPTYVALCSIHETGHFSYIQAQLKQTIVPGI